MDFEEACIRMNLEEIPPYPDDPHSGYKHVYACHDEDGVVLEAPYPEGTRIVKASRKSGQDFPFLIATAEKQNGEWEWTEYTRNFDGETFLKLPLAQSVCTDCHAAVADTRDWIFTEFEGD